MGAISGPQWKAKARSRRATATPGRGRAWGAWGPFRAPSRRRTRNRGAPRLRRAASKRGGHGGHFGPPVEGEREIEARHGYAGPRPSEGGMGAISGPQWKANARSRRATATPGRVQARGAWGPFRAPRGRRTRDRGAPRLRRAASKRGGHGGHL